VACHAYNGVGLQRALDGGCDSIEHGLEITDAQIAQMAKQGTWYCPRLRRTITTGRQKILRRASATANARKFMRIGSKGSESGIKIAYGTDIGGIEWTEPMAQEFPYLVQFWSVADRGDSCGHVARSGIAGRKR